MGADLSLPTPMRNQWMGVVSLAQPAAEWFVSRIDRNRKNRAEHGNGSKAKATPAPKPKEMKDFLVEVFSSKPTAAYDKSDRWR